MHPPAHVPNSHPEAFCVPVLTSATFCLSAAGTNPEIRRRCTDMACAMAERMEVTVRYVPLANPGELADAAGQKIRDVVLIGAEPQRAEKIAFSPAYVEIASTYLVGPESKLRSVGDIDRPGVRIASTARAAY